MVYFVICLFLLLNLLTDLQLSAAFTGKSFCDEKSFDNMFQDKQYIYLNVFDSKHQENRLYRWVYGSSQIDQIVTENVDSGECSKRKSKQKKILKLILLSDFLIPQSGYFSNRYDGMTVQTYYQPKESGNSYVTFCASYGPEKRSTYNSTEPYPLFPVCNCTILDSGMQYYSHQSCYEKKLLKERLNHYIEKNLNKRDDFPYMFPEDNSLNNKYRSLYFRDKNETLQIEERLFVFKRYSDRELAVMDYFFASSSEFRQTLRVPLDMEVVGLVSIYDKKGNISISYLLEEVAIDEINYVAQYIWEANVLNSNYSLMPTNRKHWREFFGCYSTTALPLFTVLGILLYTIIVVVAISKCDHFLYRNYKLTFLYF